MKKLLSVPTLMVIAVLAIIVSVGALLSVTQTVPSGGRITAVNLGIFSDAECTSQITFLDWGNQTPGSVVTKVLYVKNTGNLPESLSFTVTSWVPAAASGYITLTWVPTVAALEAGQSCSSELRLEASSSAGNITAFSCTLVFTGTEYTK